MLFKKSVVRTKFEICVFIIQVKCIMEVFQVNTFFHFNRKFKKKCIYQSNILKILLPHVKRKNKCK